MADNEWVILWALLALGIVVFSATDRDNPKSGKWFAASVFMITLMLSGALTLLNFLDVKLGHVFILFVWTEVYARIFLYLETAIGEGK